MSQGSTVEPLNSWLHVAQGFSHGCALLGFDLMAVEIWFSIGALISGCMQPGIKGRVSAVVYQEPGERTKNGQGEIGHQGEWLRPLSTPFI